MSLAAAAREVVLRVKIRRRVPTGNILVCVGVFD